MICVIMILLNGWCRTSMRPARLVSYAFLYTTNGHTEIFRDTPLLTPEKIQLLVALTKSFQKLIVVKVEQKSLKETTIKV